MTYSESLDWLYGLQVHGIKLGLDNVRSLCEALRIETNSSEKRKFIHVAGTNGKGSICAMAAAMLCASGQRTGLYTSPHLVSFRERIRLGIVSIERPIEAPSIAFPTEPDPRVAPLSPQKRRRAPRLG